MDLILYKNFSKRKNSTKVPGDGTRSLTILTKQPTSIESPVFIVTSPVDIEVNYAKWAGHYYYVDDIILSLDGFYEIHCTQDVLATHRDVILGYRGYVERGEYKLAPLRDKDIVNGNIPSKNDVIDCKRTVTSLISHSSEFGTSWAVAFRTISTNTEGVFNPYEDGVVDHVLSYPEFQVMINGGLSALSSILSTMFVHPTDYISCVNSYPIPVTFLRPSDSTRHIVRVGKWSTGQDAYPAKSTLTSDRQLNLPSTFYGDWRDYNPKFTTATVRILNQTVQIDPVWLQDELHVELILDIMTGTARAILYAKRVNADESISRYDISIINGNIGCDEQITHTDLSNKVNGFVTSVISGGASAISGNAIGVASAGMGILNTVAGNADQSINGSISSRSAAIDACDVVVNVYRRNVCDDPKNYVGYPVNIESTPAPFTYVQMYNPSISIAGLGNDRDMVNSYLSSGIYIE